MEEHVAAEAEDAARAAVAVEGGGAGRDAELAVVEILNGAAEAAERLAGEAAGVGEAVEAIAHDRGVLHEPGEELIGALEAVVDAGVVVEPAVPEVALDVGAELVERRHGAHGEGPLDQGGVARPLDGRSGEGHVVRADEDLEELEAVIAEPAVSQRGAAPGCRS